jgi:pyruvate/2-oxoglutarate/acetoin dehydrogenase E1 component
VPKALLFDHASRHLVRSIEGPRRRTPKSLLECKAGRVVIVHEASRNCGVGAEVVAIVAEKAFQALKAPIVRLTGPDIPAPSSYALEQAFVPQADQIAAAAKHLV